jgi:hypothetical protein
MGSATFVGGEGYWSVWSNPSNWEGGLLPRSNNGLSVVLDTNTSVEDLGTSSDPFVVHDVTPGLGFTPSLLVSGFLYANDLSNLAISTFNPFIAPNTGSIDIQHDATNTSFDLIGFGPTVEIGHDVSGSVFSFAVGAGSGAMWGHDATLILARPPQGSLNNEINLPPVIPMTGYPGTETFSAKIELGGISFNQADFIPPVPGSTSGDIRLLNNGKTVYNLSNVTVPDLTNILGVSLDGSFSTGYDKTTGDDYVVYSHA